ncbi:toxin [Pseudomonas fluorescens]|uniref:Toxin n=1 Tax=Pseudomonas fluorescens TaxID=294 RepID=A0A327NCN3_PSEFL|nr:toxin [Pseudomonas fluorescens]
MHRHTPSLTAIDPRGLPVRAVGYWRDIDGVPPQARVNDTAHDWAGRAIAQWDPRLFPDVSAPANLQTIHALSGAVLSTNSVDAGWRVALLGEAGQSLQAWDSRGSQRWMRYDTQLRPVSVFEQAVDGDAICTERLSYGTSDQTSAEHNQCGQLIRHDDPAGTQRFSEFGLHGGMLEQTRHFLKALSLPDWPEPLADRELMLEVGEGAITRSHLNALGEVSYQTDAKGHRQLFSQTLDGQLREVRLQLNATSTPKTLVSAIGYNAHGQTEREVAGNGVITTLEYDTADGRLTRLQAQRGNAALQDLRYAYDPVGNVLNIEDAAQPIRYFANQRIESISRYCYDTLYQLIEATGWEAGTTNKGPQFSPFDDPAPRANYRQTYRYDAGGNLLELIHQGPQSHGHRLVAAARSNRCLPVLEGVEPDEEDFRRGFDANGNLLNLQPGQALSWDLRNQLGEVRSVERDSGIDDRERYVYGADGMRVRKVLSMQTNAQTLVCEVRYLPNLELRSHSGTGEVLQVISVQAGRSSVRMLHWESVPPKDIANDQYRYHLNDHLGSCTLELDIDGEVISQERYHPYGTTAWFAGRGEVEASYRTVRYSGKERDATGLYYYGFRYYIPRLQHWISPDPAGYIDGLNLYRFVRNNPVTWGDPTGTVTLTEEKMQAYGEAAYSRMFSQGSAWAGHRGVGESGLDAIQRISNKNIESLLDELDIYDISQNKVATTISKLSPSDYTLVHFSKSDFRKADGDVEFLSRRELQATGRLAANTSANTSPDDLIKFATDDFAFFSLDTGTPKKTSSTFGKFRYNMSFEGLRGQSHVEFADLLNPNFRQISSQNLAALPWFKERPNILKRMLLSESEQAVLTYNEFTRRTGFAELEPKDLLFFGDDMLNGIGLRVAAELPGFSSATRKALKKQITSQPIETIGGVINALGRPQVLTPRVAAFAAPNITLKQFQ